MNMVVLGTPPDRTGWFSAGARAAGRRSTAAVVHDGPATTVVVANGQFLRGHDLVPRGHPGDGRAEVQVYALRRGRAPGDARPAPAGHPPAPSPDHEPRPAARIEVDVARGALRRVEIDGVSARVRSRT